MTARQAEAPDPSDKSAAKVRAMFARIAPRYDLLNHLLSGGCDILWRRAAAARLGPLPGERILDLCTGTGDLALAIQTSARRSAAVVAADFTLEMLARAAPKFSRATARIAGTGADAMRLPFLSNRFDAVTAAFGVRNIEDHRRGFREMCRVLKPGGRLLVLEFTPRPTGVLGPLVTAHMRHVLPRLGRAISKDAAAYQYLPDTVDAWPAPEELASRLRECGFERVTHETLFPGCAAIHVAWKGAIR